ncbi:MAG: type I glyceraldehyde-3-phosphate dehydrogenase [Deltaproteobacteria bacterium]|nr:MAG: type I glyceraldehyde-3-phosphate dehydrogenase [Deltaproteobacteria bacterium]TMB30170.1 MAG: type I glyceraldehyde-3-phosphate dehydrogenase [Deltaproteobacteria bacterium]TMB36848.1 MAG: type I glyceraldehyde-3-phosphate dehydrogenase [Deltaproteobacteria bacterium]
MARIAINGFGRIGRNILRAAIKRGANFDVVHINDIDKPKTLAHLFKFDSVHGIFEGKVEALEDAIVVNGKKIAVTAKRDPSELPHKQHGCDIVLECSGRFTNRVDAQKHIAAGAKKVIISAPAKGQDFTVAFGINHEKYDPKKHEVISNASCTTNCLAPISKVLLDNFGIERGFMTTVHSYTNDQRILDLPHEDLRRARAAAVSMIPASTGAAKAIYEVIPELKGKLSGTAIRVPTPNVSIVDLTVELSKKASVDDIHKAMRSAAEGKMKGVLQYNDELTVSVDYNGNPHSSIYDSTQTAVTESGSLAKVFAWYDNEWGFSNRMVDVALLVESKL